MVTGIIAGDLVRPHDPAWRIFWITSSSSTRSRSTTLWRRDREKKHVALRSSSASRCIATGDRRGGVARVARTSGWPMGCYNRRAQITGRHHADTLRFRPVVDQVRRIRRATTRTKPCARSSSRAWPCGGRAPRAKASRSSQGCRFGTPVRLGLPKQVMGREARLITKAAEVIAVDTNLWSMTTRE